MSGDHPNYSIVEIGQNTEKGPEDLKRVAVTQTPVRKLSLTLVRKIPTGSYNSLQIIIICYSKMTNYVIG